MSLEWKRRALRKLKLEIDRTDDWSKLQTLIEQFVGLTFDILEQKEKRRITEQ